MIFLNCKSVYIILFLDIFQWLLTTLIIKSKCVNVLWRVLRNWFLFISLFPWYIRFPSYKQQKLTLARHRQGVYWNHRLSPRIVGGLRTGCEAQFWGIMPKISLQDWPNVEISATTDKLKILNCSGTTYASVSQNCNHYYVHARYMCITQWKRHGETDLSPSLFHQGLMSWSLEWICLTGRDWAAYLCLS